MPAATVRLAERGRRWAEAWRTDLSDAGEMARLRSRVFSVGAAMGLLSMILTMTFSPQTYLSRSWLVPAVTAIGLAVFAVWTGARGPRLGELEFCLIVLASQLFAAITTDLEQPGLVARVALCLLAPVLLAAVFAERARLLAVQPVVSVALLVFVARHASQASNPGMDVCVGGFSLVAVAGAVRLLRELAIRALRTAKEREITDPLTGLINRRGLERLGSVHWRARARERLPIAVLVIDVDHFKRVNDTQGHGAGDEILRRLAAEITAMIRADDLAVRLGGEEFLVLSSTALGTGEILAERIRTTVEREVPGITVSIGVHESLPGLDDLLPAAIWTSVDAADHYLYQAKESGRNRVMAAARRS
jgi:diguanylate cyclase (GGDEF)-like protein